MRGAKGGKRKKKKGGGEKRNSVLNRSCGWFKSAASRLYTSSFHVTDSEMKATKMMVAEFNIESVVFPWCLPSQLQPLDVSVKMSCNYTCKHA